MTSPETSSSQGARSALSIDGYFNTAKNPTDWPWSFNRETGDLVVLTPSHSQLACMHDLIDAIIERDPRAFKEFNGDLSSFTFIKKQVNSVVLNAPVHLSATRFWSITLLTAL